MQKSSIRLLIGLLALLPALAWAQAAGRVLMSVGEVSVQRGAATIPLARNSFIFPGDTIRLGADSNAQIRFSDESIVGLRAGSVFRVDEYQFSQGSGKGIFSLLAGGMRTVTGQIGRLAQDRRNYAVRTPTSTIGIRGTHYTVVHCNNDCGNAKTASALLASAATTASDAGPLAQAGGGGSSVPNGTYGGVTDGRISASPNEAPDLGREFGHDEYFYVATPNSAPEGLLAPPAFLHDRLSGQRRSSGQQGQESGETLAQGGINAESRPGSVPEGPQPSTFVVTEQKTPTGESTVVPSGRDTAALASWITPGSNNDLTAGGVLVPQSVLSLDSHGRLNAFTVAAGCVGAVNDCDEGISGTLNAALEEGSATFPSSTQKVFWGRWNSGTLIDGGTNITLSSAAQAHLMYAPLTPQDTIAAKTGTLSLQSSFSGGLGTTPTNNFGATPVAGEFPAISVNFTSRTISVGSSFINFANVGNGTQNWSFGSGSGTLVLANGGAYFLFDGTGSCSSSGTACNGSSVFTAKGRVAGIFIGPAGDHVGAALSGAAGTAQFSTVRVYCPTC
ncbi:MAG: FecR domain-containing protein [Burkholderiales bacterium]